ncbi:SRPBCC domain-containing protein [uncultured Dokdonia sp.]|uniref:SRPBCC family protein n=1 Tax=uncultured Dokdonia sp. TaxID=575653 RepID=UPI00260A962A|nr:SRPBCC domain-containing protein [uncultured Dokdonia sp.]
MKDIISKEQLFNHPIQKVWEAITHQDQISTWFISANFKAEKGYQYTFNTSGDDCSPIHGEVLEATPYTLIYSWIVTENPIHTILKWVLEEVDGGTKLYLEHSGISKYEGETAVEMFESFYGGWDNCLKGLTDYLKEVIHAG